MSGAESEGTTPDVEAHALTANINEAVVEDEPEVEAHGTDLQSNETVVEDQPRGRGPWNRYSVQRDGHRGRHRA